LSHRPELIKYANKAKMGRADSQFPLWFRFFSFRILQIPAFLIPDFTDSGFYRFRNMEFTTFLINKNLQ
jgi:hypothetical protein